MEISTATGATGALLAFSIICWLVVGGTKKKSSKNLPPSLPHLPIVGSLPFLSGLSNLHVCLTEKCKKYGKIYSVMAGSKYLVVLNGHATIREALIKNSSEYAGRGELFINQHIWRDQDKGVALTQPGDAQRKTRSTCLNVLKSFGFGSRAIMEQKIQEEVSHLLQYVHSMDGRAWYPANILEHTTMNVIHNLMFGKRFPHDDKIGMEITDLSHKVAASINAMHDVFPFVTKLPNVKCRLAEDLILYKRYMAFWESEIEESLNSCSADDDNFVREFMKLTEKESFDKRHVAIILRDLMLGGTETTSGQLNWALILLANHPDVQSRLQQELDSVVPRDRLPSLHDKPRLSYMEAVIEEVLRLRTGLPLSLPHMTTDDTQISGYEIPAGTEIMVNLWSANMDPEVWKEPEIFNPGRFLDDNMDLINKDLMITFSYGKRSCLGEILARQEMFLFLSALVQQFHILPPEGEVKVKDDMVFIRTLTAVEHQMRLVARNE